MAFTMHHPMTQHALIAVFAVAIMAVAGASGDDKPAADKILGKWNIDVEASVAKFDDSDDPVVAMMKQKEFDIILDFQSDKSAELTIAIGDQRQEKKGRWKGVENEQSEQQIVISFSSRRKSSAPKLAVIQLADDRLQIVGSGEQRALILQRMTVAGE